MSISSIYNLGTQKFDHPSIQRKCCGIYSKVMIQLHGVPRSIALPWQIMNTDIIKRRPTLLISSIIKVRKPTIFVSTVFASSTNYNDSISSLLTDPISMEPFWKKIAPFEHISQENFLNYKWQLENSLRKEEEILKFLESVIPSSCDYQSIGDDIKQGMQTSPMSVSLTPYVLSCIDWKNVLQDPLRKQFLPMHSQQLLDHPMLTFDSLAEQSDSPVPGIVHRYPSKALFLATSVCPIYCRFCTRSYSIGEETRALQKQHFMPNKSRWQSSFEYIASTSRLEDVVVSGGDTFFLTPQDIELIGNTLLAIPHIRRIRFATRGLTAAPMRFLSDKKWTNALLNVEKRGRQLGKHVSIQVHFNHPNEITWVTKLAAHQLFSLGITLRNQTPLLRGINDSVSTMSLLIRQLAYLNIQPYYVFQGDMVKGVEDLRTPLSVILNLEKHIQGTISGYYCPKFIVDLPGGGGKRLACSFDSYDPMTGISEFSAPGVKGSCKFFYYDPLHALPLDSQQNWLQGHLPINY